MGDEATRLAGLDELAQFCGYGSFAEVPAGDVKFGMGVMGILGGWCGMTALQYYQRLEANAAAKMRAEKEAREVREAYSFPPEFR